MIRWGACLAWCIAVGVFAFTPDRASAVHHPHARRAAGIEVVQTTADLSQRLTRLPDLRFSTVPGYGVPVIHVNDAVRDQRVAGFGGGMTDTSAWLLERRLSPAARAATMNNLFGVHGIHLSFVRVPMGASDFTRNGRPYTYDDLPPGRRDPRLSRFSIAHDRAYVLPVLREMLAINPRVRVLATPWSPPAWMKTNGRPNNWGDGARLLPNAYRPLARYFVKFIRAYTRAGVGISAITPQNEPLQGTGYPGMGFPAGSEANFIVRDLRPALRAARLHPKIFGYDFSWRDGSYPRVLSTDVPAARAISGIAWHCYTGYPSVMSIQHYLLPRLEQLETECSPGIASGSSAELVIASMRNWASTVLLWNLTLDTRGGPVEPPNGGCGGCTGLVSVGQATHRTRYSVDYYQLGQASAFIAPGARRIGSEHFVSYAYSASTHRSGYATQGLDDVAFENPDASKVLLAHNSASYSIRFAVETHRRWFTYTLVPGATVTMVWDRPRGKRHGHK